MKTPGVYILQSAKNGRYYIGSTEDIERRIAEHNNGKVLATKQLKPLVLKAFIKCGSLKEARQSEYKLKNYKSRKILEKVVRDRIFPWNYRRLVA